MRIEDVAAAARIHRRAFPDYFLTHMGQRFLERFYGEFVDQPGDYGLVATGNQALVGCVIGTTDDQALYDRFYRRNLGLAALILLQRLFQDAYIRRNITTRMGHVRRALLSALSRRGAPATGKALSTPEPIPARLLSLGIDPSYRRHGIAAELVEHFCRRLWEDGVETVGLSVRVDNRSAIAFYQRTGWQQGGATDTSLQFYRSTAPLPDTGKVPDA